MLKAFRIISVILLLSWMILIFSLSAENAKTSSKTSGSIVNVIISIVIPDYETLSENEQLQIRENFQFVIRKTAHFTIYGVLGVLAFLSIVTYKKIPFCYRLISPAAFCLLYSISDEVHQRFIPGRSGEIRDVFIDFCGSLLGIAVVSLILKFSKSKLLKKYI